MFLIGCEKREPVQWKFKMGEEVFHKLDKDKKIPGIVIGGYYDNWEEKNKYKIRFYVEGVVKTDTKIFSPDGSLISDPFPIYYIYEYELCKKLE